MNKPIYCIRPPKTCSVERRRAPNRFVNMQSTRQVHGDREQDQPSYQAHYLQTISAAMKKIEKGKLALHFPSKDDEFTVRSASRG